MSLKLKREGIEDCSEIRGILERECRKRKWSSVPKVEGVEEKGDFSHFEFGETKKGSLKGPYRPHSSAAFSTQLVSHTCQIIKNL